MEVAGLAVGVISFIQAATPYILSLCHKRREYLKLESKLHKLLKSVEDLGSHVNEILLIADGIQGPFRSRPDQAKELRRYKRLSEADKEMVSLLKRMLEYFDEFKKDQDPQRPRWKKSKDRLMWHFDKDDIVENLDEFYRETVELQNYLQRDDAKTVHESNQIVFRIDSRMQEEEVTKLLNWLCPFPLQSEIAGATSSKISRPDSFVDSSGTYQQWMDVSTGRYRHLNLFGVSGSGKTFRSEAVMLDLRRRFRQQDVPVLSIAFRQGMEAKQTPLFFLCSLLRQLYARPGHTKIPPELQLIFEESKLSSRRALNADEAYDYLAQELKKYKQTFVIVDGLDKAGRYKNDILTQMTRIRQKLHACIFSTDQEDPRDNLQVIRCDTCGVDTLLSYWSCKVCPGKQGPTFDLCQDCYWTHGLRCIDSTHQMDVFDKINLHMHPSPTDIETFVEGALAQARTIGDSGSEDRRMFSGHISYLARHWNKLTVDEQSRVPSMISAKVEGNYLLAKIFVERLVGEPTLSDFQATIEEMRNDTVATTLDHHYDRITELCLQQTEQFQANIAPDHLSLVACAAEVLSFNQLSHAFAVKHGDRTLMDFKHKCCDLQVVHERTKTLLSIGTSTELDVLPITFQHQTLTEYFDRHYTRWFPDADQKMFDACMAYFDLDIFATPFTNQGDLLDAVRQYPFITYAAAHWGTHARRIPQIHENLTAVLKLFASPSRLNCLLKIAWLTNPNLDVVWDVDTGITPLHVAAFNGLAELCHILIEHGHDPDSQNLYGRTALHYACAKGFPDVVSVLIQQGADLNISSGQEHTPLREAMLRQHDHIIDLLLASNRCDVNKEGGPSYRELPLQSALQHSLRTFNKLLDRADIQINGQDANGTTVFMRTLMDGRHADIAKRLLQRSDLRLDLAEEGGRRAIDIAAEFKDTDTLMGLILHDGRSPQMNGRSLTYLMGDERTNVVQDVLTCQGVNWIDHHGRTLLHIAAATGLESMVSLVLSLASQTVLVDIEARDHFGRTALHAACESICPGDCRTGKVPSQFSRGACICDDSSSTIRLLLQRGALPLTPDNAGKTPLDVARENTADEHAQQLIDFFGPFLATPSSSLLSTGRRSLVSKAMTDDLALVEDALTKMAGDIPPDQDVYTGMTVLHRVARLHSPDLLKLLLSRSKQKTIDAGDENGATCLHDAAKLGWLQGVEILIEFGAELDAQDAYGQTPFAIAQQNNDSLEIAVILAAAGAQLPAPMLIRQRLLYTAIRMKNLQAIDSFVGKGVNPFHQNRDGVRPLLFAEDLLVVERNKQHNQIFRSKRWMDYSGRDKVAEAISQSPAVQKLEAVVERLRRAEREFSRPLQVDSSTSAPQMLLIIERLNEKMKRPDSLSGSTLVQEPGTSVEEHKIDTAQSTRQLPNLVSSPQTYGTNVTIVDLSGPGGVAWAVACCIIAVMWMILHHQASISTMSVDDGCDRCWRV